MGKTMSPLPRGHLRSRCPSILLSHDHDFRVSRDLKLTPLVFVETNPGVRPLYPPLGVAFPDPAH